MLVSFLGAKRADKYYAMTATQLSCDELFVRLVSADDKLKKQIKKQAVDLAVELSVKALEDSIDENVHRKLISDFIAKVGM